MSLSGRAGVVVLMLASSAVCMAQEASAPGQVATAGSANGITLSVVVTPKNGDTHAAGLTQQDFSVFDNGAPADDYGFSGVQPWGYSGGSCDCGGCGERVL